jgi:hypothetical protein
MFSLEVAGAELEGGNENTGGWGPAERNQNGLLVLQPKPCVVDCGTTDGFA